ncbi:MAG: cation transporter, partial [Lachnospiraceae bacterium]|nr:cation transporter [Lachnospiraceae bacterium]
MKKTYKVDVDCANCAAKMEAAVKKTAGVKDASLS